MLRRFLLQNLLKIRKILSFHLKFDCRLKPERIYRFLIVVNLKRDHMEIFFKTQKTAIPTHKIITAQI